MPGFLTIEQSFFIKAFQSAAGFLLIMCRGLSCQKEGHMEMQPAALRKRLVRVRSVSVVVLQTAAQGWLVAPAKAALGWGRATHCPAHPAPLVAPPWPQRDPVGFPHLRCPCRLRPSPRAAEERVHPTSVGEKDGAGGKWEEEPEVSWRGAEQLAARRDEK